MRGVKSALIVAAFVATGFSEAFAEVSLEGVHWQVGLIESGRVVAWRDVRALPRAPRPSDRLRARLVLRNEGARDEEGLLLRYSLTARVLAQESAGEGAWAVPFSVDEKRVPKIGAKRTIEVQIDAGRVVELFLRRLSRESWRMDRLKIQLMLEPHREAKALQIGEDTLEVGRGS